MNKDKSTSIKEEPEVEEKPEIITHDEMNKIAAEILRAEMFGNEVCYLILLSFSVCQKYY